MSCFLYLLVLLPCFCFLLTELFGSIGVISSGIKALFFIVYSLIVFWTVIIICGFVSPPWMGETFCYWQVSVFHCFTVGKELSRRWLIILSSALMRWVHRSLLFWLKVFGMTWHFMDITLSGGQCIVGCFHDKRASIIGFCQAAYSLDCDDCQSHTGV